MWGRLEHPTSPEGRTGARLARVSGSGGGGGWAGRGTFLGTWVTYVRVRSGVGLFESRRTSTAVCGEKSWTRQDEGPIDVWVVSASLAGAGLLAPTTVRRVCDESPQSWRPRTPAPRVSESALWRVTWAIGPLCGTSTEVCTTSPGQALTLLSEGGPRSVSRGLSEILARSLGVQDLWCRPPYVDVVRDRAWSSRVGGPVARMRPAGRTPESNLGAREIIPRAPYYGVAFRK